MVPVRQSDDDHCRHRDEDENFQGSRDLAHHLDAAYVDPGQYDDERDRDEVVLPPRHFRKVVHEIIGEQDRIGAAQQE